MKSIVIIIEQEVERRSLLRHPFYQMWTKGELTQEHLSGYAKEYFQLVKSVPEILANLANQPGSSPFLKQIHENREEEADHVNLWLRFASSLGLSSKNLNAYEGLLKTIEAVNKMKQLSASSFEAGVAAMYAYELELPKISKTKLDGLQKFYGLNSPDSSIYFQTHEEADVRHAAVWRRILQNFTDDESNAACSAAVVSLEAQNRLLDSVMEGYVN